MLYPNKKYVYSMIVRLVSDISKPYVFKHVFHIFYCNLFDTHNLERTVSHVGNFYFIKTFYIKFNIHHLNSCCIKLYFLIKSIKNM